MPVTDTTPASNGSNSNSNKQKLIIFDTTLRDGEQSPGVTLTVDEKVEIARQLSSLGVDVLEAGFPVASQGDFDAVQRIAREIGPLMEGRDSIGQPMVIAGLSRSVPADIQRCYDAIKDAPRKRIHTFLATSDIHLVHKLRISREECIERAVKAVTIAKSLCEDVEFSPEDAGRSDPVFLCQVLGEVIKAGATTLNIPDTVGYNLPEEMGKRIKFLIDNTPGSEKAIWSVHCHNDLGLATANTLAAVQAGARQVEVTINGIGERAGNTALEEVVMGIHTHPDAFPVYHTINTRHFTRISTVVSTMTGMTVQPNKAIVGRNAFRHESGIHQDGMLKNKTTYEIIRPEDVGVVSAGSGCGLVLGKHSGRGALKQRIVELGFGDIKDEETINEIFVAFKKLADGKKKIRDQDVVAIVADVTRRRGLASSSAATSPAVKPTAAAATSAAGASEVVAHKNQRYALRDVVVVTGMRVTPMATITLVDTELGKEVVVQDAAIGASGPVTATFNAIQRIVGLEFKLVHYEVQAVSGDEDALGQAVIKLAPANNSVSDGTDDDDEDDVITVQGVGLDSDIVIASAKAYVAAMNKLLPYMDTGNGTHDPIHRAVNV
ncbi:2-isopropylmalate synthase [Ramicandelaber brevisporus]|nr:2-isopropylmalate synthase [Ramicandelaber brevisporus]